MPGKSELAQVTNIKNGGEGHQTWSPNWIPGLPTMYCENGDKQTNKQKCCLFSSWIA